MIMMVLVLSRYQRYLRCITIFYLEQTQLTEGSDVWLQVDVEVEELSEEDAENAHPSS